MCGGGILHSSSVFRLVAPELLMQQGNMPKLQTWPLRTEAMVFVDPTQMWEQSCS